MRAAVPGPEVILTKESGKIKPRENMRHFLAVIAGILTVGIVLFLLISFGDQIQKNLNSLSSNLKLNYLIARVNSFLQPKSKIAREGKTARMANSEFTPVYFADLEYDPKTGITRQIKTGTARGDFPRFLSNQPKPGANKFIYKVEVLASPKEIIDSGWVTEYKNIIQTNDGKLSFRINVTYRANSIIKVYLTDKKLIWTGQTNKKETII